MSLQGVGHMARAGNTSTLQSGDGVFQVMYQVGLVRAPRRLPVWQPPTSAQAANPQLDPDRCVM